MIESSICGRRAAHISEQYSCQNKTLKVTLSFDMPVWTEEFSQGFMLRKAINGYKERGDKARCSVVS